MQVSIQDTYGHFKISSSHNFHNAFLWWSVAMQWNSRWIRSNLSNGNNWQMSDDSWSASCSLNSHRSSRLYSQASCSSPHITNIFTKFTKQAVKWLQNTDVPAEVLTSVASASDPVTRQWRQSSVTTEIHLGWQRTSPFQQPWPASQAYDSEMNRVLSSRQSSTNLDTSITDEPLLITCSG